MELEIDKQKEAIDMIKGYDLEILDSLIENEGYIGGMNCYYENEGYIKSSKRKN